MERAECSSAVTAWAAAALPAAWMGAEPEILVDNDEILLIVSLPAPGGRSTAPHPMAEEGQADGVAAVTAKGGLAGQGVGDRAAIAAFREGTRAERIALAAEAEERFGRKVSWGARLGEVTEQFTIATVPVMTRLRFAERRTLDTLINAGLARSRSEALAWCVRLVGANEQAWIAELQAAFEAVAEIREQGPRSTRDR